MTSTHEGPEVNPRLRPLLCHASAAHGAGFTSPAGCRRLTATPADVPRQEAST
jgi:hypothetical protein